MDTAGGVTAPEAFAAPQKTLVIRRDTTGQPHLPGTSVAGSLRAYCESCAELAPDESRGGLFGSPPGEQGRVPSPVQVLGTVWHSSDEVQRRTRTAIDRGRGAADNNTLHTVEQLPAGTQFDVHLRWDDPDDRLPALLERLQHWRPLLGRGVSTGAGRCTVIGIGHDVHDLSTVEGLHSWLQLTSPADYPVPEPVADAAGTDALLDVEFAIVDGLHIGTGSLVDGEHNKYAETVRDAAGTPTVPGSSLKGVLRSRAEYICRVLGAATCDADPCGNCVPCRLFGYTGKDRTAQRAKITVHDAAITEPAIEYRKHVALDRFTGGAAPELLYTDEVITAGSFTLRVEALQPVEECERLLLEAVVADLDAGLIGIGARTTAGQGTVRVVTEHTRPAEPISHLASYLAPEAA